MLNTYQSFGLKSAGSCFVVFTSFFKCDLDSLLKEYTLKTKSGHVLHCWWNLLFSDAENVKLNVFVMFLVFTLQTRFYTTELQLLQNTGYISGLFITKRIQSIKRDGEEPY